MRIDITRVLEAESGAVCFSAPVGRGRGLWRGAVPPEVGAYDVEFEVPDVVRSWGLVPSAGWGVEGDDEGGVSVTGVVERIDDDSVVALRIQSDVLLVEILDGPRPVAVGDCLRFTAPRLELYPYEL
ncbi:hypothetical protein [Streptomyces abikoensis]|uniref:hypothetical protein n=1 Tax=Streptomyces abikoensis TaxID=97398 RepID=UPI001679DAE9|nr:hypothetical protein [Streptomyces abikoensis]GGP59187.1 hypothetical protein GCM10010214_36190 [Streptomyces abikoensis]